MDYLYRVVYRIRPEHWDKWKDPAENIWKISKSYHSKDRPYTRAGSAKGAATSGNNSYPTLEFKVQRLPATDWEFIDGS